MTFASLNNARAALLDMAARYPDAIVPANTVGVQAQPISFGHYVLAYAEALDAMPNGYAGPMPMSIGRR